MPSLWILATSARYGLEERFPTSSQHQSVSVLFTLLSILPSVLTFDSCRTGRPIATKFPGHGSMIDQTTERSFDSQATWVIDVLGLCFDLLCVDVFTTRHWQMSGRLVQESNICTVQLRYLISALIYHGYRAS